MRVLRSLAHKDEHPFFISKLKFSYDKYSVNKLERNLPSLLFQSNCLEFASYICIKPQTSRDTICMSGYVALHRPQLMLLAACVKHELDKLYHLYSTFASLK